MRRRMRFGTLSLAVAGLSLGLVPVASADPADVTASAAVEGSQVTVTYHNGSDASILCSGWGLLDPRTPTSDNGPDFYTEPTFEPVLPGQSLETIANDVPDGSYHFYWACMRPDVWTLEWGTIPMESPTAEPLPVVVGSGDCFGPSCPPPGKAVGRPWDMPDVPGPRKAPPAGPWAN